MAKDQVPEKLAAEFQKNSGEADADSSSTESDYEIEAARYALAAKKHPQPEGSAKPSESSDGDDDESATESDEPGVRMGRAIAGYAGLKAVALESAQPSGSKRLAEGRALDDGKRMKQLVASDAENSGKKPADEPKRQLFERMWSEEDEIAVLEGVLNYARIKKADPGSDLNDFHEFVRGDIRVEVTGFQLKDKIRRLRNRYVKVQEKEDKRGKDRVFKRPNAQKRHQLSKQIWGGEPRSDGVEILIGKPKRGRQSGRRMRTYKPDSGTGSRNDEPAKAVEADKAVVPFTAPTAEEAVLPLIGETVFGGEGEEGPVESEERHRLRIQEMELYIEKLELVKAQAELVLKELKDSR